MQQGHHCRLLREVVDDQTGTVFIEQAERQMWSVASEQIRSVQPVFLF